MMEAQDKRVEEQEMANEEEYEPDSGTGRLKRLLISTVIATLVVLLLVFMFSERQPPEIPKEKTGGVQLKIPLDDDTASAHSQTQNQQMVPVTGYPADGESPMATESAATHAPERQQSTMAVNPGQASSSAMPKHPEATLPPLPSVPGDAPSLPAAAPREMAPAPAKQSGSLDKADGGPTSARVALSESEARAARKRRELEDAVRREPDPGMETKRDAARTSGLNAEGNAHEESPARKAVPVTTLSSPVMQPGSKTPASKAATPVLTGASEKYIVQFGAFKTRENAENTLAKLRGLNMGIRIVPVSGGQIFKVQSSVYMDREQARKAAEMAQAKTQVSAIIAPHP